MSDRIATLLEGRREHMARVLGTPLTEPTDDTSPLSPEAREHLLGDGTDLYWNELEWENLTEEEALDEGGALAELVFPGLLAYVRGLLLTQVNPDALAPAEPRPQVVRDLLAFLAKRVVALEERVADDAAEDRERHQWELDATSRLVDLVLHQYYGLTADQVDRLEAARKA